jgi:hypothetical protein
VTPGVGLGTRTRVADDSALLIGGRGRRHRLGCLSGLAEAAAAVLRDTEPAANHHLIEGWHDYQPKHGSHGGHHQQFSCHGRPPGLLQGRDQGRSLPLACRRCNRQGLGACGPERGPGGVMQRRFPSAFRSLERHG